MSSPVLAIVYDLREADAWREAHTHRAMWGRRYTDVYALDTDHIALVFRPAPDARGTWRSWERVRSEWILREQVPAKL
jgi:hypothetical protein